MKILPILYNQLFIRYDCFLAATSGIDILEVSDIKYKLRRFHLSDNFLLKDHKFYKINCPKLKNIDLERFTLSDYAYLKDYVFLANNSKIIFIYLYKYYIINRCID
jgi:hypothetical protein